MPYSRIAILVVLGSSLGCAANRQPSTLGSPEVPEHVREQDAGPASQPAPQTDAEAIPTYVAVDLDEHGISASLKAPTEVEIKATTEGVELWSEDGFHLFVGRGTLDMPAERAELVRAFGDEFVRFLDDTPEAVVWEIRETSGNHFHFFATQGTGDRGYHCRTPEEGVDSPQLVRELLDVCRGAGTPTKKD